MTTAFVTVYGYTERDKFRLDRGLFDMAGPKRCSVPNPGVHPWEPIRFGAGMSTVSSKSRACRPGRSMVWSVVGRGYGRGMRLHPEEPPAGPWTVKPLAEVAASLGGPGVRRC
jgi:hypothetical protein